MFEVRILGTVDLRTSYKDSAPELAAQPKPLAVLTYLALATPRALHRRDKLVGLLWPESAQTDARHALRQALYVVGKAFGNGIVKRRGTDEVGLDWDSVWCDAIAFEDHVTRGNLPKAMDLYQGDLLEGFYVPEAPEFERWLDAERRRLRRLALEAAGRLAEQAEVAGDLASAVQHARRALALAPYDEPGVRRLIALLSRRGDRAAALRAYEEFARRLVQDLELEPSAATQALVAAVRVTQPSEGDTAAAPAAGVGPTAPRVAQPRQRTRWRRVAGAISVAVAVLAFGAMVLIRHVRPGPTIVANRVVVIPFENLTGDSSLVRLSRVASDWISQGLAQTGLVEVISTPTVLSALKTEHASSGAAVAQRGTSLATQLHAGLLVHGSYDRRGDTLELQATVTDVGRGTLLGSIDPVRATATNPSAGLDVLRQRVMGILAFRLDQQLATWARAARTPPTYPAYEAFVAGLETDNPDDFYRAAAQDSTFAMAWIALLGHFAGEGPMPPQWRHGTVTQMDTILQRVERLRPLLAPVDRLYLDANQARWNGDLDGAYRYFQRAFALSPDLWLELAQSGKEAGRYEEVVRLLSRDDLPMPPRATFANPQWQRWSLMGIALHFLGRYDEELELARHTRSVAPSVRAAVDREGTALAALGRVRELDSLVKNSLVGDDQALTLWQLGIELLWHDQDSLGRVYINQVVDRAARVGQVVPYATILLGRWERARALYDSLSSGPSPRTSFEGLARAGAAAARMGDTAAAREYEARILERSRATGQTPQDDAAWALATLAAGRGNCRRAAEYLRESFQDGHGMTYVHRWHPGAYLCRHDPAMLEALQPKG